MEAAAPSAEVAAALNGGDACADPAVPTSPRKRRFGGVTIDRTLGAKG